MFALQFLSSILFILFGASHIKRIIGGFAPSRCLPYPKGDVCLDARKHLLQNGALTFMLCRELIGGHMGHRKARRFTGWILLRFNCIPQIQLISRRTGSNPTFHPNGGLLVSRPNQAPEQCGDLFEYFKSSIDASPIFRITSLGLNTSIQRMVMHSSGNSFFMQCHDTGGKYFLISYRFDKNHSSVSHTILNGHRESVNGFALSPEGTILVSASSNNLMIRRVSEDGIANPQVQIIYSCVNTVYYVEFHHEKESLIFAYSGLFNGVILCKLDKSLIHYARRINIPVPEYIYEIVFLKEPSKNIKIALASSDKKISLWSTNFESVECCMILDMHQERIRKLSIHPKNERIMVSTSFDGTTIVWWLSDDNSSATPIQILQGRIGTNDIVFAPSGRNLLVSTFHSIMQVFQ